MEYFLIEKADICIKKIMEENYDTVGVMKCNNPLHYHGNFWWAKTTYLKELFKNHTVGENYIDPELFLFKNNPKACDLYPAFHLHHGFSGYFYNLSREKYCY
jgi:hypothetical protein